MCAADEVMCAASETGTTPYDVPNVELGHVGELCGFDAFVKKYRLTDPALQRLAAIVRGADTGRPDLTPESPGLLAISWAYRRTSPTTTPCCARAW